MHYTVLDGDSVVYRAKVDRAAGAVRLTSVVKGRNPAHCTAADKLLLSYRLLDRVRVTQVARVSPVVTGAGVEWSVVVPSPSWPYVLSPQHQAVPLVTSPHESIFRAQRRSTRCP